MVTSPGRPSGGEPPAGPFDHLEDVEVLELAKDALRRVQGAPLGGLQRSHLWAAYEQAKAELDVRMYRHILAKLRQRGAADKIRREEAR